MRAGAKSGDFARSSTHEKTAAFGLSGRNCRKREAGKVDPERTSSGQQTEQLLRYNMLAPNTLNEGAAMEVKANNTEVLITGIEAIGTTADCCHAYVQCQFQDGELHPVLFGPELASAVCGAFLSATANLQKRRHPPGAPTVTVPIRVDRALFSLAKRPGSPNALMMTFETSGSGAELQFELSDEVVRQLAAALPAALIKLNSSIDPHSTSSRNLPSKAVGSPETIDLEGLVARPARLEVGKSPFFPPLTY